MEDWLADGVPLAAPVAREALSGWYGANTPGRGQWRVAGLAVNPAALTIPAFCAIPARDRLVPAVSARALAEKLSRLQHRLSLPLDISAWWRAPMRNLHSGGLSRPGCTAYDERKPKKDKAMEDIVIVSAARTPVGSFNGAFAATPAHVLGTVALKAALARAGLSPEDIDEVILGQVLTAAEGQNPARQAARAAGIPDAKTAFGINQVCGSGLRTVALAAQQIISGESNIVIAGGQESMSLAPHAQHLRAGTKMGDLSFIDTMIKDGLWDAFNGYHMGVTAENVAKQWQITRDEQDALALGSQQKASAAQKAGQIQG